MMNDFKRETLNMYKERTAFMRHNYLDSFMQTNPKLEEKVDYCGKFKAFWGDTVVFKIDSQARDMIHFVQDKLYSCCRNILATPLSSEQFHMTLHDLDHWFGCDKRWEYTQKKAENIISKLNDGKVHLKPVCVFPMVNTSLVIGYIPADSQSCFRLMEWFSAFEEAELFPLSYPPTFHVTIAYFRPGFHDSHHLISFINHLEDELLPSLNFSKSDLVYWRFTDMNHYF